MAGVIYAHIIRAVYAEIKVGREDFFFPILVALSLASCCCRLSVILVQNFTQWQKILLQTVKNPTGCLSCFNVASVTAASEAQDIKIVWK